MNKTAYLKPLMGVNFEARLADVRELGFDDRFLRTWRYYLAYCEAAFRERHTGLCQLILAKPDCELPTSYDWD
jgi:cyclopropane fatty-acyl-phospholipid synthase-like methyltransferase